jgi:hypothetical protein
MCVCVCVCVCVCQREREKKIKGKLNSRERERDCEKEIVRRRETSPYEEKHETSRILAKVNLFIGDGSVHQLATLPTIKKMPDLLYTN